MHSDIKEAEFRNGRSQELSPRSRNRLWYYAKVYQYFLFKSNGSKTQMPKSCVSLKCINFMFLHTYIHAYIHTYLHTCMYTYIYSYTCMHAYIHTYIRTYIHIYICTSIHTYVLTYVPSYVCTYIHTQCFVPKVSVLNFYLNVYWIQMKLQVISFKIWSLGIYTVVPTFFPLIVAVLEVIFCKCV